MNHNVTLKDIAQACNVSVTAVSLVLNGRPTRMSQANRELIFKTAERLHYVPNQAARSLATNQSMLLALLIPDIENMFFASLSKALEDVVSADGYSLLIANSDDSRLSEQRLLRQFASHGVDGLFLIPSRESADDSAALKKDVANLDFPVVLTDRLVDEQWCDAVGSDDFTGGTIAAQILLAQGHRRIACISGDNADGKTSRRMAGFVSALDEAGIQLDPSLKRNGNYRFDGGYKEAGHIIDAGATAVFCGNDLMAMGFIKRLEELGLRCPEDCSVVGYDNMSGKFGFNHQLTTFDQNIHAVAEACHGLITSRIAARHDDNGERHKSKPWLTDPKQKLIEPKLVRRTTVSHA
ncbi:LacI family DNA-binding transcriptional regulator [Bifidobacterium sp. ESL0790]|uniref:LacI family DNA-binding transcriptional regulator n=1 Tax=Bifidobacterium sp. ESL0790 TaxID=2983233 RepID=UPI0023F6775A|nr:LacI family DNA-binding transcriptional regulator [Bifidobacterium sp. ESL0790]WEV72325.1 LacI family DNA-binding transcriptional regulator [Bifidobacterium sp. ESL0790]